MSNRKPRMSLARGEERTPAYTPDLVEEKTQETKVPFATLLPPSLYEKLRAAAFWEGRSIADVTADALATWLAVQEKKRGAYEVLPPHRVKG